MNRIPPDLLDRLAKLPERHLPDGTGFATEGVNMAALGGHVAVEARVQLATAPTFAAHAGALFGDVMATGPGPELRGRVLDLMAMLLQWSGEMKADASESVDWPRRSAHPLTAACLNRTCEHYPGADGPHRVSVDKCDGDHGMPTCSSPICWHRDPPEPATFDHLPPFPRWEVDTDANDGTKTAAVYLHLGDELVAAAKPDGDAWRVQWRESWCSAIDTPAESEWHACNAIARKGHAEGIEVPPLDESWPAWELGHVEAPKPTAEWARVTGKSRPMLVLRGATHPNALYGWAWVDGVGEATTADGWHYGLYSGGDLRDAVAEVCDRAEKQGVKVTAWPAALIAELEPGQLSSDPRKHGVTVPPLPVESPAPADGVPLPSGLRFVWINDNNEDDDNRVEIEVLPSLCGGPRYRCRTPQRQEWIEGATTPEQLRAWYDAREAVAVLS